MRTIRPDPACGVCRGSGVEEVYGGHGTVLEHPCRCTDRYVRPDEPLEPGDTTILGGQDMCVESADAQIVLLRQLGAPGQPVTPVEAATVEKLRPLGGILFRRQDGLYPGQIGS